MTPHDTRHFAVRQVNPFDGVLQVVEIDDARAYSANGRVWQLQVRSERPDHTWRSQRDALPVRQFFNYGLWDVDDGLRAIPANPVLDIGAMTRAAERLSSALRDLLAHLPFALVDRYECWSVDQAGKPVALLATSEDRTLIPQLRIAPWRATGSADAGFVAPSLIAAGRRPDGHAEQLEHQVRKAAHDRAWFERLDGGRARRVDGNGRRNDPVAIDFPPTGLRTDWPTESARRLAQDYLDWLAPRLLLLDTLDDSLRRQLEQAACRQANALAAVYPLIPRIIDHAQIDRARVESQLRRAAR